MLKKAKTVQKEALLPRVDQAIELDSAFPAYCYPIDEITDRPITFLHRHDSLEIGYCHDGHGIFIVESKVLPFGAGDVILVSQAETHLARASDNSVSHWTWLYVDLHRLLGPTFPGDPTIDLSDLHGRAFNNIFGPKEFPRLNRVAMSLIDEFRGKRILARDAIRAFLYIMCVEFRRANPKDSRNDGKPESDTASVRRIRLALEAMLSHYRAPIDIPQLAHACALSPAQFRRVFLRATGKNPYEYLTMIRLSSAATMLQTSDRKVSDIAASCGFSTLSSFNRKFLAVTGKAPREWRLDAGQ